MFYPESGGKNKLIRDVVFPSKINVFQPGFYEICLSDTCMAFRQFLLSLGKLIETFDTRDPT